MQQAKVVASGPLNKEISRGIVNIYKDYLGRGPTHASTAIVGEMVISPSRTVSPRRRRCWSPTDSGIRFGACVAHSKRRCARTSAGWSSE